MVIPLERARTGEFIELEITYQSVRPASKMLGRTLANLVLEDENHVRILGLPSDVVPFHAPVDVASSGLLKPQQHLAFRYCRDGLELL
jgi:hypothetical protein